MNDKIVDRVANGFELRTGSNHTGSIGGRIHQPDPAAVARLKQINAEQASQASAAKQARLQAAINRAKARQEEKQLPLPPTAVAPPAPAEPTAAPKKPDGRGGHPRIPVEVILPLYERYCAGETQVDLARESGISNRTLSTRFKAIRQQREGNAPTKPKRKAPQPSRTVAKKQYHPPQFTVTAPATVPPAGSDDTPAGVVEIVTGNGDANLIQALTILLGLSGASVRGKIRLNFDVEVML